jgi:hypothetical protein
MGGSGDEISKCSELLNSYYIYPIERPMNIDELNHYNYVSSSANCTGKFLIDSEKILEFILTDENAKNYKFTECVTPYYKLFFDIDLKEYDGDNIDEIGYFFVYKIVEALKSIIKPKDIDMDDTTFFQYIYSDKASIFGNFKNKKKGLHLYFPRVIVNVETLRFLLNYILNYIIDHDDLNIGENTIKEIFDTHSLYGIKVMFQGDPYYKINKELSTYKTINSFSNDYEDKIEQLRETIIRTDMTDISFEFIDK